MLLLIARLFGHLFVVHTEVGLTLVHVSEPAIHIICVVAFGGGVE